MLRCGKCGGYTLAEKCPLCKVKTKSAKPPKFSTSDKYGKYRRMAKAREWKQQ